MVKLATREKGWRCGEAGHGRIRMEIWGSCPQETYGGDVGKLATKEKVGDVGKLAIGEKSWSCWEAGQGKNRMEMTGHCPREK